MTMAAGPPLASFITAVALYVIPLLIVAGIGIGRIMQLRRGHRRRVVEIEREASFEVQQDISSTVKDGAKFRAAVLAHMEATSREHNGLAREDDQRHSGQR